MERYENIVKSSEIRKLVVDKKYQKALTILLTMDVSKIKVLADLSVFAEVYIQTGKYDEAERLLKKVRAKMNSRRVIKQLVMLAVRTDNVKEAERYYDEFVQAAPYDADRYILRYRIDHMKNADVSVLIASLEALKECDYFEKWAYELAKLYQRAGKKEECIRECNDIILWFGEGVIVEKAKLLKASFGEETKAEENKMDSFSKSQKILENNSEVKYNHKSLQDIPKEGDSNVDYEYIYNNEQLQAIFNGYFENEELKKTIISYLGGALQEKKASSFIVEGADSKSRTSLSKAMAKAAFELALFGSSRIAKISAEKLNEISLEPNYKKLKDSFLVIEQASKLTLPAKNGIVRMAEEMEGNVAIILQDEEQGIEKALEGSRQFASLFSTVFRVPQLSRNELIAMALKMLQEEDFELDEEANICLETACNQIAVNVVGSERANSLKELIEGLCERAEQRSMHDIALANGKIDYGDSNINKIIASDF